MARPFANLAFLASAFFLATLPADAGNPFVPSWIKNDAPSRSVTIDIVAGWNNNNFRHWNFNGYYKGNLTILVPAGWQVTIDFTNAERGFKHSLLLTRAYPQMDMPLKLTAADAVGGVATRLPSEGIAAGESDHLAFRPSPGTYYLASGALVQMVEGMYIQMEVREAIDHAAAVFNRRVPARDDQPFRP